MSGFIAWLEKLNGADRKPRAELRRSLSFEPGRHVPAFPYVEPFVKDGDGWRRDMHYLVAGLWAAHWREGRAGVAALAVVVGRHDLERRMRLPVGERQKVTSIEKRFIALLDADAGQLAYRLRQMTALLAEHSIDFEALLSDLIAWNSADRRVQIRWARDFYRTLAPRTPDQKAELETAI